MFTIRQIERLWNSKQYRRLAVELLQGRPEASYRLEAEFGRSIPAAALALVRMDELAQSHHPLYRTLLNVLIVGQEADGGWGDVMTTALCVRALTWLLVPKMTQNVRNDPAGIFQRYRLGPASVISVATAPPASPFKPVISWSTYR